MDIADAELANSYKCVVKNNVGGQDYIFMPMDLPACFAVGRTIEEAASNGRKAVLSRLEQARRLGVGIPDPSTAQGAPVSLRIRMPKQNHLALALCAERSGTSLNELVVQLLLRAVRRFFGEPVELRSKGCTSSQNRYETRVGRKPKVSVLTKCTGSWPQRLPRELHFQIGEIQKTQGVSLNLMLSSLIIEELIRFELEEEIQLRSAPKVA